MEVGISLDPTDMVKGMACNKGGAGVSDHKKIYISSVELVEW